MPVVFDRFLPRARSPSTAHYLACHTSALSSKEIWICMARNHIFIFGSCFIKMKYAFFYVYSFTLSLPSLTMWTINSRADASLHTRNVAFISHSVAHSRTTELWSINIRIYHKCLPFSKVGTKRQTKSVYKWRALLTSRLLGCCFLLVLTKNRERNVSVFFVLLSYTRPDKYIKGPLPFKNDPFDTSLASIRRSMEVIRLVLSFKQKSRTRSVKKKKRRNESRKTQLKIFQLPSTHYKLIVSISNCSQFKIVLMLSHAA